MSNTNHQHILETPSSVLQIQWNAVRELFGNDEFNILLYGTFAISTAVYWIVGLFFTAIDLTGKPEFFLKYKIQKTSNYPLSFNEILIVVKQVIFNQIFAALPVSFVFYHLLVWRGYDSRKELPTLQRTLSELLFCILLFEIFYFYLHRFLHGSLMFRYHKLHHTWTSPIAISAAYCHPVEHVVANLFPIFMGPWILGSHVSTLWLWFSVATIGTMMVHSGFHILPLPKSQFHDHHHEKKNRNFGFLGMMDRIYGTQVILQN